MTYEIKYRSENEMKDSGIDWLGKVPDNWTNKKFKYIFKYIKGRNPAMFYDYNKELIPYVNAEYLRTGITDKYIDSYNGLIKSNDKDILLLWDGANAGEFFEGREGALGSTFARLDLIDNQNFSYLKHYIYFQEAYLKESTYGMGIPHVNSQTLNNLIFNVPENMKEQEKIANFLDLKTAEFDSIISKKEDLIEKLQEAKKSLISEVVTGKVKIVDGELIERKADEMKDSGIEWLGMIPKDWEDTKFKRYIKINSGKEILDESKDIEKPINVYGSGGIFKKTSNVLYSGEAVLFGRKGTIGKPIYLNEEFWTVDTMYYCTCNMEFLPSLLYYQLLVVPWDLMSTQTALPSIVGTDIGNLLTVIPKIKEQYEITTFLDFKTEQLNSIITKTKFQIQKLKQAKQSLISEAVTGKIDLRDWEIQEI